MRLLSSTSRAALGAFSFARLNGLTGARRAADEKPKDDKESRRAEDDKPEHYDDDGKGKHAEKGEDDGDDEDKDKDKDKDKDASRRAEKDDEDENEAADDEDDEEMKKAKAAGFAPLLARARQAGQRAGRLAERARIGRILSSEAAAERVGSAAHIACNTGMSSAAAIGLLKTMPAAKSGALDRAMSRVPQPQPGGAGAGSSLQTPGQLLLASAKAHAKEIEDKKARRA